MRIIITGAESSGKSTIAEHLGRQFHLPYALEYARFYLEEKGPEYDLELLIRLSRLHLKYQRAEVDPEVPIGIFDTDMINYKIWAEEVFGHCPGQIFEAVEQESSHVYLLCKPDLPWEADLLRESPNDREILYQRHLSEVKRLNRPYVIVAGDGFQRLANAEAALESLMSLHTGRL
ncbi:AAA family ATPase [Amphritea japonica]|uniref:Nad metabolism ATPase/kinase-like protein n=1 Tax=Amphritea japonica ATCC BAA-1530 TaxID=1278309 RepID=A0A7R6P3R7_9GAMM|nr:ATP-binding protein [Amphritea japonica]BBB26673.1 nad metabolism ATPase/kinase-like protein [Amphritea japonica ATCC BAA-1530]